MRPDRHSGALAGIAMVVTATACFGVLDTITKFISTAGVPVASTRPLSTATSQSYCSASSM